MAVGLRDGAKLLAVITVCGCMVFVCTFFINYYIDASSISALITEDLRPLYEAQLLTAKLVCLISGFCLLLVCVILLLFYIKLYINAHEKQLGLLKAMGYSDGRLALSFSVFGLSVFLGTAVGFACGFAVMPIIYRQMGEGLPEIAIRFHAWLPIVLVLLPSVAFSLLSALYAKLRLRRSALDMMNGRREEHIRPKRNGEERDRPFLVELRRETLKSRKSLVFFIGFAGFCFASMTQMSFTMLDLAAKTMAYIVFMIGIVLALTAFLLAFTSLVNANAKTASLMRAYGYSLKERAFAVIGGYRLPAYIGFGVGTLYQYALLSFFMKIVFRDAAFDVSYSFDFVVFFAALAVFALLFEAACLYYADRCGRASIREITA